MDWLQHISQWLTGGEHPYHNLFHCMNHDTPWVVLTVTLDLSVALGYVLIAYHWFRNERLLPQSPARSALTSMRNIFIFCGLCGYIFIPVKMFWPAWRLYDMFLAVLAYYTWSYALNVKNLKVIYSAIGRTNELAADLAESREVAKRKGFFLNAVSHDLRTPLNGLLLNTNLAETHAEAGDMSAVRESLNEIKAATRLTADLLDGLLEYARMENAEERLVEEEFDLDQLMRDLLNAHSAAAARKGLKLVGRTDTALRMHTDRLKLERILNNLISNAIKFTSKGSVTLQSVSARENLEIHVVDTGIGIGPDAMSHLFEEFFQAQNTERDRSKGFGLGLAISRKLARHLGGDIVVESSLGHGSRFTVVLPDAIQRERTRAEASRAAAKLPASTAVNPSAVR